MLQGFEDESAYRVAREAMLALPAVEVPLGADAYLEAADLLRAARRFGLRVRSDVDCLIAVCAIRHRLDVLHRGRDFELLARIAPLRARAVRR